MMRFASAPRKEFHVLEHGTNSDQALSAPPLVVFVRGKPHPNGNGMWHLVETFTFALRLRLRVGPRADEFVGGESPLLFALSLRLPGTAII